MAAMENTSWANTTEKIEIRSPTNVLCRLEGIVWSSVFSLLSFFIVVGNLLTIVLFAANKRVRKKKFFLVINMAFADLLFGAFVLPAYSYNIFSTFYQLSTANVDWMITPVKISYTISSGVSLISAALISCERFYAIYRPFRHRRVTVRTYQIFIFISWTPAVALTAVSHVYLKSNNTFSRCVTSSYIFAVTCIICGCNMAIWRKVQHGNVISQQKNRDVQNVRLTKTLMFASILNLLCWIPLAIVGIDHESVLIPTRWLFITVTLNSCNAFINPLLYAVRVQEFRKALALSCVRKRAKMNPENIKTRGNHAAVLSQETYLKAYESESNTHALKFHKNFVETKL